MGICKKIWLTIFISCLICAVNQGQDAVAISENIKKFAEVYGFATKMMNLGGSFVGATNDNGIESSSSSRSNNYYVDNSGSRPSKYENSFMGYKPMASFFDTKNFLPSASSVDYSNNLAGSSFSEYGGGPLGAASSRSQPRSIIESLMGTFLGSSVDNNNSPSFSNSYASGFGDYGSGKGQTRSGSDIEAIVRSLTRSGAKRAEAEPDHLNILGQFFGKRKK